MKKYVYIIASFLVFISCKNEDKKEETKEEGYVIKGKIDHLPQSSLAILSYKQNDSSITDSAIVKNGSFEFKGKVNSPETAFLTIRHGKSFPQENNLRDHFSFYIENSEMIVSTKDSIKNASIEGSLLNKESSELSQKVSPLTNKIMAIQKRMKGKTKEQIMASYDTIQIYVDSIREIKHNFIVAHPHSYKSLEQFLFVEAQKGFDAEKADELFQKFDKDLRETSTGKLIADKIAIGKRTAIGQEAMDFTQTTLEGKEFKLSSLRGKYVLIDFWAAWCKPCRAENPNVVKAYNKYKSQNFEIVGVSLDASKEQWENAIEKDGLPWIHVSDLKYWKNEVAVQYDINSVPANVLVDPNGIIIAKNLRGEVLKERLSEIFDKPEKQI